MDFPSPERFADIGFRWLDLLRVVDRGMGGASDRSELHCSSELDVVGARSAIAEKNVHGAVDKLPTVVVEQELHLLFAFAALGRGVGLVPRRVTT